MSRRVSWRASLWEVWLDTAPQRETAAILLCGPLLLACQLNVKDRSTNYGTPAYGQKRIPSSNDGPCQLHACPGQRHMVFTAKKKKEKNYCNYCHLLPWWQYTCSLVGMLNLAACLALAHHSPARREGLGIQLSLPQLRGSQGDNYSSRPQKWRLPDLGTDVTPW